MSVNNILANLPILVTSDVIEEGHIVRKNVFKVVGLDARANEDIPWYDPTTHKAGDKVRMKKDGQVLIVTIPELDADQNAIPTER